jgi:hypothetical protein
MVYTSKAVFIAASLAALTFVNAQEVEARDPHHQGHQALVGNRIPDAPVSETVANPASAFNHVREDEVVEAREDVEPVARGVAGAIAKEVGKQAAGGAVQSAISWVQKKLRDDEEFANLVRDYSDELDARGAGAAIAKDIGKELGKQAGQGALNSAVQWVQSKIRDDEEFANLVRDYSDELDARGAGATIAKDVGKELGKQAGQGALNSAVQWVQSKIRDDEEFARDFDDWVEARDYDLGYDARDFYEYPEARGYEEWGMEAREYDEYPVDARDYDDYLDARDYYDYPEARDYDDYAEARDYYDYYTEL